MVNGGPMKALTPLDTIKESGAPIVIFGVGAAGEALLYALDEQGLTVDAFTDNNPDRAAKVLGVEVVRTDELRKKFPNAAVIIAAADIHGVVPQLEEMGFHTWHPGSLLLEGFDLTERQYSKRPDLVDHAVEAMVFTHNNFLNPGGLNMRSVDIIITEKCSMKCVDCSNLNQYARDPKDFALEEVAAWTEQLLTITDNIGEIRVIGGEPFMNKQCSEIVEYLAEHPKVNKVVIYTNATIPLRLEHIERMGNRKIIFMITNYGNLSRNHTAVTTALEDAGIRFNSEPPHDWTECGSIVQHHRTPEEQRQVFNRCCGKELYTVVDGRFYRCPFAANAVAMGAIPNVPTDYVDLVTASKEELREYATNKPYLEACDWCNGRDRDAPKITPGIQTKKPVPYERLVQITTV